MSITNYWYEENAILVHESAERWTGEAINDVLEYIKHYQQQANQSINHVIDMSESYNIPSGFMHSLRRLRYHNYNPNSKIAIVAATPFVNIFNGLNSKIYPDLKHMIRIVESIDEALNFIQGEETQIA